MASLPDIVNIFMTPTGRKIHIYRDCMSLSKSVEIQKLKMSKKITDVYQICLCCSRRYNKIKNTKMGRNFINAPPVNKSAFESGINDKTEEKEEESDEEEEESEESEKEEEIPKRPNTNIMSKTNPSREILVSNRNVNQSESINSANISSNVKNEISKIAPSLKNSSFFSDVSSLERAIKEDKDEKSRNNISDNKLIRPLSEIDEYDELKNAKENLYKTDISESILKDNFTRIELDNKNINEFYNAFFPDDNNIPIPIPKISEIYKNKLKFYFTVKYKPNQSGKKTMLALGYTLRYNEKNSVNMEDMSYDMFSIAISISKTSGVIYSIIDMENGILIIKGKKEEKSDESTFYYRKTFDNQLYLKQKWEINPYIDCDFEICKIIGNV